jgi:hypothetical protein
MASIENEYPKPQVRTFAELSKDQYKAIMSQAAATDAKAALPTLYPPGSLILGAPYLPPVFPGAQPSTLPPAASFGFAPAPSFSDATYLSAPGSVIPSTSAPAAAAAK